MRGVPDGSRWRVLLMGVLLVSLAAPGCTMLMVEDQPGVIREQVEPDTQRKYWTYTPSYYDAQEAWPVLVVCHGAASVDKPQRQVDEWKRLAEEKAFIVVAPQLESVDPGLTTKPEDELARLRGDDDAILAVLSHVRAAQTVNTNRVFIVGWLGGAYPALFTGLRHPDVFRAIGLRQPYFDAQYVEPCIPYLDYYQPIQVVYGPMDFAKDQSVACVEWLREHHMFVAYDQTSSANKRQPDDTYAFLHRVVEGFPWIRIYAESSEPDEPLIVRFTLHSSVEIDSYHWEFGDGTISNVAAPEHTYPEKGTYHVSVTVTAGSKRYTRLLELQVPPIRLGAE
jgi:hypothetical protein